MKRILSALLLLPLLINVLSFPLAQAAASGNLNYLLGTAKVDSLAATEDALWLLSGDKLWRWQLGRAEAELIVEALPNAFLDPGNPQGLGYLIAYENQLYSLHPSMGALSAVMLDGTIHLRNAVQYPVDLLLDADAQPRTIKSVFMNQQGVWLLAEDASGYGFDLLLLDKEGKASRFNTKGIRSIASFKGDKLLAIIQEDGRSPVLAEVNTKNGSTKTRIKTLPDGADGLCYDTASDTAYYFSKGEIISRPKMGKAKNVAYLPAVFLYKSPVLLQGHLAASLPEGIFVRSFSGNQASKPTVRVYNLDEFTLRKVRAMLPDIRVTVSDRMLSAIELAQAVISNTFPYDVAVLDIRNPQLYSLIEKGYFAPLDAYPVTANAAKRIYPVFLEPVTHRSSLYALPASVSMSDYGYKQGYLDLVDMSVNELPRDILSVFDYLDRWKEEYSAYDGDVLPAFFTSKSYLSSELINLYIRQHQLHGISLSFDKPLFRQMMERINGLDDAYLSGLRASFQDGWTPRVIITNLDLRNLARIRQTSTFTPDGPTYPLCINLEPGMPTVYPYRASYVAVMTKANSQDAAARVAAAISQADWVQDMSPVLFSDYQPLISDNYLENKAALDSYEQNLKAQFKKAQGAEKRNLEQSLADLQVRLMELEKQKYVTTVEELEVYRREILPFLKPLGPSLHEDSTMLMSEDLSFIFLVRQMMDGTIDVEDFIRQADQKLRLMEMEDASE